MAMGVIMNVFNENENPLEYFTTSWKIWDFLTEKAGLDIKNYDQHIVEELCKRLSIPSPCKEIEGELKKRNISPEVFIGAFLKAIQPYAQMMVDLCKFFYLHGIKSTNKEMKILFDFGKGPKDLGFDLEHFREIVFKYMKIAQRVAIMGGTMIPYGSLQEYLQSIGDMNLKIPVQRIGYLITQKTENSKFLFQFCLALK